MSSRDLLLEQREKASAAIEKLRELRVRQGYLDSAAASELRMHETDLVNIETALASVDGLEAQREATIAQRDLASAQIDAAKIQAEATGQLAAAQDRVAAAQREMAEAQSAETARQNSERASAEDATFWFRRLGTSVGVANAAGLAASISALSREDYRQMLTAEAVRAVEMFFFGMLSAGLIPIAMWLAAITMGVATGTSSLLREPPHRAIAALRAGQIGLVVGSATFFAMGVMQILGLLHALSS